MASPLCAGERFPLLRARRVPSVEEDLREFALLCDSVSRINGFLPAEWERLPSHLMFVVTELDEAVTSGSRADFEEEVADTAIRLLCHLHSLWGKDWNLRTFPSDSEVFLAARENIAWPIVTLLCRAANRWRFGRLEAERDVKVLLEMALRDTIDIGAMLGFDVIARAVAKCTENQGRPELHGRVESIG